MKNMSLRKIAEVCGGRYFGPEGLLDREITGVTQDSRAVEPGMLFLAVKGERVDGHRFVPMAFEKGALCALVEDVPTEDAAPNAPQAETITAAGSGAAARGHAYIQVDAVLEALKMIAEFYRSTLSIPIIGITGSVGKTSTKEMIAQVLSVKYNVLKTAGNLNNEVGLPLTILRIREEHEVAVVEMGINHFGEMTRLSKVARPDFCVFTNIGYCHLEFLGDRDGVFRAKTEMFTYAADGAQTICCGDDDKLLQLKETRTPAPTFFGHDPHCQVYVKKSESLGMEGTKCLFVVHGKELEVTVPVPGGHMVTNALAGAAVGHALGLSGEEIRQGIEAFTVVGGRGKIHHTEKYTLLDDCYNANPVSMCASLDVLACGDGRKVAILGDMAELGKDERAMHALVGTHAAEKGIDLLLLAGPLSEEIGKAAADAQAAAVESGPGKGKTGESSTAPLILWYPDTQALLDALSDPEETPLENGDCVLVKASHFMGFERVSSLLLQ